MARSIHSDEDGAGSRASSKEWCHGRARRFFRQAPLIRKLRLQRGAAMPAKRGRSVRLPAGGGLLGAAGRARSAHVMQFRPVGVESSGEERAEEGPDSGEGMGVSVAAVCRGGEGRRIDGRHDESCLFSASSDVRSAFWGAGRSFGLNLLKEGFNCRDRYSYWRRW